MAEWGFSPIDYSYEKGKMKESRDVGLYWVKEYSSPNEWLIAQYMNEKEYEYSYWLVLGCEIERKDSYFSEIGDLVICPYK